MTKRHHHYRSSRTGRSLIHGHLNNLFISSYRPPKYLSSLPVLSTSSNLQGFSLKAAPIDSIKAHIRTQHIIKRIETIPDEENCVWSFHRMWDRHYTAKCCQACPNLDDFQLLPLKWIFPTESSTHKTKRSRHHALLVNESHLSELSHKFQGIQPTFSIANIGVLTSILPTWFQLSPDDKIIEFAWDVINAFLQNV